MAWVVAAVAAAGALSPLVYVWAFTRRLDRLVDELARSLRHTGAGS